MADSQDQNIEHASLENSPVQLAQAGGDSIALQDSPNAQATIQNAFISLFVGGRTPNDVDWEFGSQILKQEMLPEIKKRLKYARSGFTQDDWAKVDVQEVEPIQQEDAPLLALEAVKTLTAEGTRAETIDPTLPIIQTYVREDIKGKLLILGTPGAGKTVTLLRLAEQLVMEAIAQPKTVIPIIFELSTWRDKKQSIEKWLIEQLYETYGGNRKRKIYETWLERRVLLPLLDGLDELGMEQQQKCTRKLDAFAQRYPYLVVCCRDKEFRQAGVKLANLRGTVQLQPLSNQQIQDFLRQVGKSGLWQQIQSTPEMHRLLNPVLPPSSPKEESDPGLLRIPLFISLAAQVYKPGKTLAGKFDLFEHYFHQQLSRRLREAERRKSPNKRDWAFKALQREPKKQKTRAGLTWIAVQLNAQNKVDLLIERIQPNWFKNKRIKQCYRLILTLILLLINILFFRSINTLIETSLEQSIVTLTTLLTSIFMIVLGSNKIELVESFRFSISYEARREFLKGLRDALKGVSIAGLISGLGALLMQDFMEQLLDGPIIGPIVGLTNLPIEGIKILLVVWLILSLFYALAFGPFFGFIRAMKNDLKVRSSPNQGIWKSLQSMVLTMLFVFPLSLAVALVHPVGCALKNGASCKLLPTIIAHWAPQFLIPALLMALYLSFLSGGGLAVLQHFILRLILTCYAPVPWNLAQFLNYATERRLLQRIGGRYRFIHRELQDHFANQYRREHGL